jgi:hypothetical protein
MKKVIAGILSIAVFFVFPQYGRSQQPAAYQVPDAFHFDYEVVQEVSGDNKNSSGPKTIDYYYSGSGDYMGLKSADKVNNMIIFTKDGTSIVIDDQKKTIIIFNMKGMMGGLAAQYSKNNPSASTAKEGNSGGQVAKTGKTKDISGYTAEEYSYSNSKGEKASVWYAKVDFNTGLFYMFGTGGSMPTRPGMNNTQTPSYPQLSDPHMLVAETENSTHPDQKLTTQSISKKTLTITTKGYTINNLSNMGR